MRAQLDDAPEAEQLMLRAASGTPVRAGRPAADDTQTPGRRIGLHAGPDGGNGAGEALTPAEARQLAAVLLRQAAAAEGGTTQSTPGQVEVSYLDGESYAVETRGHALLTDQPAASGGADAAMTPTELLVASLGACVAFYAGRYLERHGLNRSGLHVTAAFSTATDRPARVGEVRLTIRVPGDMPASREAALLAVASHCTVHNTLRQAPGVAIELARP